MPMLVLNHLERALYSLPYKQPGLVSTLIYIGKPVWRALECTANHPGSRGVADIMSVTMPLLITAEDDPLLYI